MVTCEAVSLANVHVLPYPRFLCPSTPDDEVDQKEEKEIALSWSQKTGMIPREDPSACQHSVKLMYAS